MTQVQSAAPASLVEEVNDDMEDKADAIADRGLIDLILRRYEGPVDEERTAHDVLAGDKAPVAAVEADRAVISHGEVVAWGDNEVVTLNMAGQVNSPFGGYVASL